MPTINDIKAAKHDAIECIQARINGAIDAKNATTGQEAVKMTDVINDFGAKRDEILMTQYMAGLKSAEMRDALDAIESATEEMNDVAENMKTATTYISNAADFLGAGSKVVSALTG